MWKIDCIFFVKTKRWKQKIYNRFVVRPSLRPLKIMSVYPNPSCSECDQAIHVYCVKKNDEKFKLLEQAHCAKCWKPLYYNTNWPGSHESLRPPFYSPLQPLRLSVAQCGHIYHTQCIVESRSDNHCPSCFVWIQRYLTQFNLTFFRICKYKALVRGMGPGEGKNINPLESSEIAQK